MTTDQPRTTAGNLFLQDFIEAEEVEDDALMRFDDEHPDIEHDLGFPMGCGKVKAAILAIEAEAADGAVSEAALEAIRLHREAKR